MKDFDTWNKKKKRLNERKETLFYHEREIWWCALGVNVGYEQDGTGEDFERPVLVLKGYNRHVCLIVPLTTSEKKNKYYIPIGNIDKKHSSAIVSQVRLIDTKRFSNKVGVLEHIVFEKIRKAVKDLL